MRIVSRVILVDAIIITSVAVFPVAMIASQAGQHGPPDAPTFGDREIRLWLLGIAGLAFASLTYVGTWVIGIRCPHCRRRLTSLLMGRRGLMIGRSGLRLGIDFCPYCGLQLDKEYDSDSPPGTPQA